jgi:shikimate kinase
LSWKLHRTVVLVGMMGAGKTAVGTQLARRVGVRFLDSDEEIVRAAQMTIPEIFARDGEAFFREREAEVIARLLAAPPAILSTGGGAFMAERNRAAISAAGLSVWLRADLDLLWSRVRNKTTRPLLQTANPLETLRTLCAAREPIYALADVTVDAQAGLSLEAMTDRVLETIAAARPDVLERRADDPV